MTLLKIHNPHWWVRIAGMHLQRHSHPSSTWPVFRWAPGGDLHGRPHTLTYRLLSSEQSAAIELGLSHLNLQSLVRVIVTVLVLTIDRRESLTWWQGVVAHQTRGRRHVHADISVPTDRSHVRLRAQIYFNLAWLLLLFWLNQLVKIPGHRLGASIRIIWSISVGILGLKRCLWRLFPSEQTSDWSRLRLIFWKNLEAWSEDTDVASLGVFFWPDVFTFLFGFL